MHVREFGFFDFFFAFYGNFLVKSLARSEKRPKISPKNSCKKSPTCCVPKFHVSEDADQIWGQLKYLVAQIFEKMRKFVSKFRRFSYTNRRERPKMTQLRQIISQQPLRVERQVSPFWKENEQGYNICENGREYFFDPGTPPLSPYVGRVPK